MAVTRRTPGRPSRAWHVYVVECRDGSLYTGIARDVDRRVALHNDGKGARYTRSRRPVRLVYQERKRDKGSALRREYAIKQLAVAEKRRLVAPGGGAGLSAARRRGTSARRS